MSQNIYKIFFWSASFFARIEVLLADQSSSTGQFPLRSIVRKVLNLKNIDFIFSFSLSFYHIFTNELILVCFYLWMMCFNLLSESAQILNINGKFKIKIVKIRKVGQKFSLCISSELKTESNAKDFWFSLFTFNCYT
jgi:hypothetical protein